MSSMTLKTMIACGKGHFSYPAKGLMIQTSSTWPHRGSTMMDITATSGFFNQAGLFLLGLSVLAGLYLLLRRRQSR